jgi:transposase
MLECPRCKGHRFWSLQGKRKRCKGCRLTRKFTKTIWDQTRISSYWKGRLIEYFCLGVPAYRLRFHVLLHAKTVERWFGILRKVIYEQTIKELQTFKGTIEMDETVFGGRRKGQGGWRAQDKHIVCWYIPEEWIRFNLSHYHSYVECYCSFGCNSYSNLNVS